MADRSDTGMLSWVFLLVQVPALFSVFNPSPFFDARRDSHERASVDDIRRGYMVPTLLAMTLGGAIAVIDRSPIPLLLTATACGAMIASYEWSIANPREPMVPDLAQAPAGTSGWGRVR